MICRYCGYLPQYKYRIGKTYGRHSVEILTDDSVRKSGRFVLSATEPPPRSSPDDPRRTLLRTRQNSWGNQNYTDQMVPGYTGGDLPFLKHNYVFGNKKVYLKSRNTFIGSGSIY